MAEGFTFNQDAVNRISKVVRAYENPGHSLVGVQNPADTDNGGLTLIKITGSTSVDAEKGRYLGRIWKMSPRFGAYPTFQGALATGDLATLDTGDPGEDNCIVWNALDLGFGTRMLSDGIFVYARSIGVSTMTAYKDKPIFMVQQAQIPVYVKIYLGVDTIYPDEKKCYKGQIFTYSYNKDYMPQDKQNGSGGPNALVIDPECDNARRLQAGNVNHIGFLAGYTNETTPRPIVTVRGPDVIGVYMTQDGGADSASVGTAPTYTYKCFASQPNPDTSAIIEAIEPEARIWRGPCYPAGHGIIAFMNTSYGYLPRLIWTDECPRVTTGSINIPNSSGGYYSVNDVMFWKPA